MGAVMIPTLLGALNGQTLHMKTLIHNLAHQDQQVSLIVELYDEKLKLDLL